MGEKISFGDSISPESLQTVIKNPKLVYDLIKWQTDELNNFKNEIGSQSVTDFIKHYKSKIKKNLENENLFRDYLDHMMFYSRMEETKLVSLLGRIKKEGLIIEKENSELEKKRELIRLIREFWDRNSRKKISILQREKIHEFFVESYKMDCKHFSIYNSFIYDSFFVVEYNCKLISAMGCFRFAKSIATSKTMGHSDVWKTLKNQIGHQKGAICDHCFTRKSCSFGRIFLHLVNLYTASIKLRMLSDYSEVFSERGIPKKETYNIISNVVIPTILEIHKFKELIVKKSKIMWSPISDKDLEII